MIAKLVAEMEKVANGNMPKYIVMGMAPYTFFVGRWNESAQYYDRIGEVCTDSSIAQSKINLILNWGME